VIDEQKLKEKLAEILERPAYRGLYTYAREPLVNAVVEAVKASEKTLPKTSGKRKKSQ